MFYAITYIGPDRGSEVGQGKSSRVLALLFVKIRFCYPAARRYLAVKLGDKGVESAAFITRKKNPDLKRGCGTSRRKKHDQVLNLECG